MRISVIIPALNEEKTIVRVVEAIPTDLVDEIIVVDNGSTDATVISAEQAGAQVVSEPRRGYGQACLTGIAHLNPKAEVVVFVDGDASDRPEEMSELVQPILNGQADLVIGSRVLGTREPGALTPQARFGNALATFLIKGLYGVRYTDLGPFRAITWRALNQLDRADRDFGWTAEMQVKAARLGLRSCELPVSYRKRREGSSKVAGSLRGAIFAGWKILTTILRHVGRD
ncbi:MAG: glycosyltransferase family 2 protein [Candidatus Latescibacterota bacterium]|nr:glycosyltransferase family 2 protein [Candidatus Latescibacterota bacterium]